MIPIFVFKFSQAGPHPVARVSLEDEDIRVEASEKTVTRLLEYALHRPALITVREGNDLRKVVPEGRQQALEARLKRFLHRPYYLSRTTKGADDHFDQVQTLPASILDMKEAA